MGQTSRVQRWLLAYFKMEGIDNFNLVLYFVVETIMSLVLVLLPIKIVFYKLILSLKNLYTILDMIVMVMFLAHVYLYLSFKVGRMFRNPEIETKLLIQNRVFKLRWFSLITPEFLYDLLCLLIAVYEVTEVRDTLLDRLLEIVYLPKIYKIKIFHDRVRNYIVGTPSYFVYNVFFGFFILIILVTYVGCVFYQIDYVLNSYNYYPALLWVNESSAWNGIIDSDFGIQLLYTLYWSLGTASAAAYGNVSATAPWDVLYNILCLYFQGFLFGFYISRLYSLADAITEKETELLSLYSVFEEHHNKLKDIQEGVSNQLYLQILSSMEFKLHQNNNLKEMESILSEELILEIRQEIYKDFLRLDPAALWTGAHALRQSVSLRIAEVSAETAEQLFDYPSVGRCDLLFLKEGAAQSCLEIDHAQRFPRRIEEGSLLNVFSFFSGLQVEAATTVLTAYSLFYVLRRKDFRELLSPSEAVGFGALAEAAVAFDNALVAREPIGLYVEALRTSHSDVLLMDPVRHSAYVLAILDRRDSSQTQRRVWCSRKGSAVPRTVGLCRRGRVSVGVQCAEELPFQTDALLILDCD